MRCCCWPICDVACWRAVSTSFMAWSCAWPMISVPCSAMLPPLMPPLPAPSEPPRPRSPELPDALDPDAPERDFSLLVDSRDWAIDHSFVHLQNWERPGG